MTNFLNETIEAIKESGHTTKDVIAVGSRDGKYGLSWRAFSNIAEVSYSSGYGAAEIATDLQIWFSDGTYMKRGEYDGSEWWEFNPPCPPPGKNAKKFNKVSVEGSENIGWCTLEELNDPED